MIKPEEFNSKLLEIQDEYKDTYEMYDYLDKSRDVYISENIELRKHKSWFKRLCIYFFICFVIEFVLFLFAVNL